jgi:carbon monoxide dehydrogenase subunit G
VRHEHTHHVAAPADKVYAALADVRNLPRYVPQMTSAEPHDGDHVTVEARYEGHTQHGEAWFKKDDERRRLEWGAEGSDYNGWLQVDEDGEGTSLLTLFVATVHGDAPDPEVMGTLDAIRRLVEADV